MVHRPAFGDWSLPKGKSRRGEHVLLTALREVSEETGHRPRLGPYLTVSRYRVTASGRAAEKTVHYWAMRAVGGHFRPSDEVDELRWLPLAEARRLVSLPRDARVLHSFGLAAIGTAPLVILRNGPTTARRKGRAPAAAPALDGAGKVQAARLVEVLAGVGARRLLAADVPACTQMLEPFAAVSGLQLERSPRLTVDGFRGHERSITAELRATAASIADEGALVVCGQRRVVAAVVNLLGRPDGHRPRRQRAVKKGGWWLLHHHAGDVVHLESHRPAA